MDDTDARKELATAEASLARAAGWLCRQWNRVGRQAERLTSTADIDAAKTQVQQDTDSLGGAGEAADAGSGFGERGGAGTAPAGC